MTTAQPSELIEGILIVRLASYADERGRFVETYRQEWFPGAPAMVQGNRSDSRAGVLRGLHFHRKQADYWYVPFGRVVVALHDLRVGSPTHGRTQTLEAGEGAEIGVYIPPGVAHGFQAVVDSTMTYMVDAYYDGADEFGVAWDDPTAAVPWPVAEPILSPRDMANPKIADIPPDHLPVYSAVRAIR